MSKEERVDKRVEGVSRIGETAPIGPPIAKTIKNPDKTGNFGGLFVQSKRDPQSTRGMPAKQKLLTVKIGEQKFFVSDRGLVLDGDDPNKRPIPGREIDRAINALAGVEGVSFPIIPLADFAAAIRKRRGFFSSGALIVALDRLMIPLRLDAMGNVIVGVSTFWIRKQRALGNVYQRELLRAHRNRADASRGDRMTQEASERSSDAYRFAEGLKCDPYSLGVDRKGFEHERY